MIRKKSILRLISILLLGTLTLIDTHSLYLESENLAAREEGAEREELDKGAEGKDWLKLLNSIHFFSVVDGFHSVLFHRSRFLAFYNTGDLVNHHKLRLYIKNCCLRLHFG